MTLFNRTMAQYAGFTTLGVRRTLNSVGNGSALAGLSSRLRQHRLSGRFLVVTMAILSLWLGQADNAAGATNSLSAQFNDWQDFGCHFTPGGVGSPPSATAGTGGNQAACISCGGTGVGMPVWSVDEPYINLWVHDEPLSYYTSSGQRMAFRFTYASRSQADSPYRWRELEDLGLTSATNETTGDHWPHVLRYSINDNVSTAMTNASWQHNWWSEIMFWDHTPETNSGGAPLIYQFSSTNTTNPTNAYYGFTSTYEGVIYRGDGGADYFNSANASSPTAGGNVQVTVLNPNSAGGPTIPHTWSDAVTGYNDYFYPFSGNFFITNANYGFKVAYPDGSQDIYGFVLTVADITAYHGTIPLTIPRNSTTVACLTKRIDPQGRATLIGYGTTTNVEFNYSNFTWETNWGYAVTRVMDSDGRITTYNYSTDNWMQLVSIVDPYGRTAQITPDSHCWIDAITDAETNMTIFSYYDWAAGWISSMTTPYGETTFNHFEKQEAGATTQFEQRALLVTEPESQYQLFAYLHSNSLPASVSSGTPSGTGLTFDTGSTGSPCPGLNYRDSFHWSERQFGALSGTVRSYLTNTVNLTNAIADLTTADLQKAGSKHWLLGGDQISVTELVSSTVDPSVDVAGSNPGQRVWYHYNGQSGTNPQMQGSGSLADCVALVLPSGATRYSLWSYGANNLPSQRLDTRTLTNGLPGLLTNSFTYDGNGFDLTNNANSLGQYLAVTYNTNHQPTNVIDALGRSNSFTWDATTRNLTGITFANGATESLTYYGGGTSSNSSMLEQAVFSPQGLTENVNGYAAGLPQVVQISGTGIATLTVTNYWDSLNRLTGTVFPDGTGISNIYTILDLTGHQDRMGNLTLYQYDNLEHLIAITNANQKVTQLSWCGCGALTSITDPMLTNITSFNYDNQGRMTNTALADGAEINWVYDPAGEVTNIFDGAGRSLSLAYNVQGMLTNASNSELSNGMALSVVYDIMNRPLRFTDANGVTRGFTYNLDNEPTSRTWPDGTNEFLGWTARGLMAYTNRDSQFTLFGRDVAGRVVATTNANLETNGFSYNAYNQIVGLTNGLGKTTSWKYNLYGWLTNKTDNNGNPVFTNYYNANGWLASHWTPAGHTTGYAWDPVGNLTNIDNSAALIATPSQGMAYDADNRLISMTDGIGTSSFGYTGTGQLRNESGPWPTNSIGYTYNQGHRTGMSITSMVSTLNFAYNYDLGWRMQSVTSSAGNFEYYYPNSASGLVQGVFLPNGASITNIYDSLARLTGTALLNHWGHVLDGYTYTPDAQGLRKGVIRELGLTTNTVSMGYDGIGQLTAWTAVEGTSGTARQNEQLGFGYDAADNLHLRTNGALAQTFTVDSLNQLSGISRSGALTLTGATPAPATSVTVNGIAAATYGDFTFAKTNISINNGNNSFTNVALGTAGAITNIFTVNLPTPISPTYDSNGNISSDGTRSFLWDAMDRLTNAYVPNTWKVEFAYDGFGRRRIMRQYTWSGGTWSKTNEAWLDYDGMQLVQERNTSGIPQVTYTRGLDLSGSLGGAGGIGGLVARTDATNGSTFYHSDGAGNVTALMDGYEDIVARYLWGPFGKPLGQWGKMAGANRMQFSSMPGDGVSGLVGYDARFYDPTLQRFLSRDPLGEVGGINLYGAVNNSPLNYIDPNGMDWLDYTGYGGARYAAQANAQILATVQAHGYANTGDFLQAHPNYNGLNDNQMALQITANVAGQTANNYLNAAQFIGTGGIVTKGVNATASAVGEATEQGWFSKLLNKCKFWKSSELPSPGLRGIVPLDLTPYARSASTRLLGPGEQDGTYVFVQDIWGNVWIADNGPHMHPQVLGNATPVASAGEITIQDGVVSEINNISGTFRPDASTLNRVQGAAEMQGMVVNPGAIQPFQWPK